MCTDVTATSVFLEWTPPSEPHEGIVVYYGEEDWDSTPTPSTMQLDLFADEDFVDDNGSYSVYVLLLQGSRCGHMGRPGFLLRCGRPQPEAAPAVTGLSAVAGTATATSVELEWDAYTGNTGFSVYYDTTDVDFDPLSAGTEFPPFSERPLADDAMGVEVTGLLPDTASLLQGSRCEQWRRGSLLRCVGHNSGTCACRDRLICGRGHGHGYERGTDVGCLYGRSHGLQRVLFHDFELYAPCGHGVCE